MHEVLNGILDTFFFLNSTPWQYEKKKKFHIDGDIGRVKVCG